MTTSSRNQSTRGPKPVLTLTQCEQIFKLSTIDNIIDKDIGVMFNVSKATVGRVIRQYLRANRKRGPRSKIPDEVRAAMYHDRVINGMFYKDIAIKYQMDHSYCQRLITQYKEDLALKDIEPDTLQYLGRNSLKHFLSKNPIVSLSPT